MILHLIFDHNFSDYVYNRFHLQRMKSKIVLCSERSQMQFFHYIDHVQVINPTNTEELDQLLLEISNYKAVIFHGLFYPWQEWLIQRIPSGIKVAWMFWGGEIYGQKDVLNTFLTPLSRFIKFTRNLRCKFNNKSANKSDYIFPKHLFRRVDYCLTDEEEEASYARKFIKKDFQHLWYSYYTIEETVGSLKDEYCNGYNIFLGNSATIENNHFDALIQLKKIGVGSRKIITPLSYGSLWERNTCIKVGKILFGTRFEPLVDFMPREKYNMKMLSCSIMIQPHWRPNAHGNILTGLWLGMRVYLSKFNIEYAFFKRIGCVVFSIENDLKFSNPHVFDALPKEDVINNRHVLKSIYGEQNVQNACEVMVNELCSHY